MFACPVCSSALNRTQGSRGIVWVCSQCKGRAVNVSLLRRLVDQQHFNRLWQTTWEGQVRTDRKCPACQNPMIEVPVNPPPDPLILDACKACQFVWFDASELEKIPPAPPEPVDVDPMHKLPLEARQAIAEHKVRLIAEQVRREDPKWAREHDDWWSTLPAVFDLIPDS